VVRTVNGGEIHRTPSGAIREVHTPTGAVIRHSPSGVRHVEVVRGGGRIIVANATGRSGYVQRPLVSHGHAFVQRTFIYNGVATARIYRPWSYGGREYHVYVPHHYYRPAYYVWVGSPWARPVTYGWGWGARPWYGYYGGYFRPYRTYASPAYWLADFVLATTLEAAYLSQNATVSAPPVVYNEQTSLSPEVKQAIADEVRRQMDQERADQAAYQGASQISGPPPLFSDRGPRVFLVSNNVMAFAGNQECPLVEGDVIQLVETPSPSSEYAQVKVLSSRGGSCSKGSYLSVSTVDLQEMHNHLRATVGQGMEKLQSDQGRNGLPSLPAQSRGVVNASYTSDVQADPAALNEISSVAREANESERGMIDQGTAPAGSGATVSLGMSIAQVEAALGRPLNTADVGVKRIYVYKDLKITFLNGRVSDVQ
jgi:hypothetical protein